ncbi:integrin alpha-IIb [Egretta garzetta]|uniref:integrin alpha-IIb n=1 Tax=Egretta garzetta TaxID=188379 RepID=UPI00163D3955|nr:integrin alpha-IIb [Egretta garzetta]
MSLRPAAALVAAPALVSLNTGQKSVVVGAPRANTSQPGVAQPGAVFLCSWPPGKTPCHPLPIDTAGGETETQSTLTFHPYKSHQWLGASVTSWDGKLVVGAPALGYSVAVGEFDGNPKTKEYVVGVPNKSNTKGEVEIFSLGVTLRRLQGIDSEAVRGWGTRWVLMIPLSPDVAVGAPLGGDGGSGQVFIFRGQSEGLMPVPTQRLDSPFPGPAAFGFALRGATDLDGNGCPDLLVGAYGAAKVAVYQGQPVVVAQAQLSVPDGLNPELLACVLPGSRTRVSCFPVVLCVSVTGQHIPQSIRLDAELQLDRLKPKLSRRVLLLQDHQSSWHRVLELAPGTPPLCHNLTAYLRDEADFKDKLSPIALSLSLALPGGTRGLVLYGDTLVQEQGQEKLSCNPRKENGSHVVICELGNPMKAGAQITVDMELSVSGLEDMGDAITFQLQLRSKNSPSPANVSVMVPVEAQAAMELRGNSLPATMVLPMSWHRVEGSRRLEDHGIKVEHVYQLHNKGPSTVSGVTLRLAVPRHPQDCSNATCVGIACQVPSLAKDQRALVSIHALLWMDTLQQPEHLLKQFLIQSQAWFNTSAMPYRVQPRVLPAGEATAVTEVVRASPRGEGAVPVWWVVLGVLAGLLLLTFFIVLMWKVGFFKRTRPPTEEDMQELAPSQAQEPGCAQD